MRNQAILVCLVLVLAFSAACSNIQINVVPTSADTAQDQDAAQQQLPNLSGQGYSSTSARTIGDAIAAVGGSATMLTGNVAGAAMIAKIDDFMRCYENTGSVAAQVYTDANINNIVSGELPRVGAVAIINRERAASNLLACALNTGGNQMRSMSATVEPCAGSGTFVRNNVTYDFLYAATDPSLCGLFAQSLQ